MTTALNFSEYEIVDGIGFYIAGLGGLFCATRSEEEQDAHRSSADMHFSLLDDNVFSCCVFVSSACNANEETELAQGALDEAKALMKELDEDDSDYEHYPNLTGIIQLQALILISVKILKVLLHK